MKHPFLLISIILLLAASCTQNQPKQAPEDASIQALMNRKSVRAFTSDTIPQAAIEPLLKAAMAAPSGMNVQPWSFVVLNDTSRYDEIFGNNANMYIFKQASFIVVFCADTTVTRAPRENPDGPAVTSPNPIWRDDMGACTENFLIAVEASGFGAVWTACYPFPDRMDPVRRALSLPDSVVPYSVVPVGIPTGDDQPKDKWKPERIHYQQW